MFSLRRKKVVIANSASSSQLIASNLHLSNLLNTAQQHELLTVKVRQILPTEVAQHLLRAMTQEHQLVLLTTSPVWASRLRFMAASLRRNFTAIDKVRVTVVPETPITTPQALPKCTRTISPQNAAQLVTLANRITDSALKSALMRLASRANLTVSETTKMSTEHPSIR